MATPWKRNRAKGYRYNSTKKNPWYRIPVILLALTCLGFVGWTGYLLFTGEIGSLAGSILILLCIGVLYWDISRSKRNQFSAWILISIVIALVLIGSAVSAYAGIEPLAGYKNSIVDKVSSTLENVRLELFPTDEEIRKETFNLINEAREENGLPVLVSEELLVDLAEEHCLYMKSAGECSHDGFDSRVAIVLGSGYSYVGENVAEGYVSAASLVSAWLDSPGHRENILNPYFIHTGLCYINGYACQIFSD